MFGERWQSGNIAVRVADERVQVQALLHLQ